MKKVVSFIIIFIFVVFANASGEKTTKKGFLTTKWCAKQGLFADCRLESNVCLEGGCYKDWEFGDKIKSELVLYVHDEGKYYTISSKKIKRSEFDEALNRNDVVIIGKLDGDVMEVHELKTPPPPKKSFFKGCL